jgi:hypothetical protein
VAHLVALWRCAIFFRNAGVAAGIKPGAHAFFRIGTT